MKTKLFTMPAARALLAGLITTGCLLAVGAQAHDGPEMEAVTHDGRVVVLRKDHTWEFVEVERGDPANSAVLTVTEVKEMHEACGLQIRLQNNLTHRIRSIVPRFSVYNDKNIEFDSKSQSFTAVKPTRSQYKRIQFNGIGCHEITWVRVHDAARCTIGDVVDMFNEVDGQCLSYIYVEPSDLINISK
tara:strand:+ start:3055 stop:3618 length:564 start_codon:yes stop_codon:yes gene_type:complete